MKVKSIVEGVPVFHLQEETMKIYLFVPSRSFIHIEFLIVSLSGCGALSHYSGGSFLSQNLMPVLILISLHPSGQSPEMGWGQEGNTLRSKLHKPFQHSSPQPGICHPPVLCPVPPEKVSAAPRPEFGSGQVSTSLEPADLQCVLGRGLADTYTGGGE